MENKIPARIIQTGKNAHLPLRAMAAVVTLKRLNPDFEYLFFDDDKVTTFIKDEFPKYRDVFEKFPFHIQKFDFFRYLAVFRFGGFYFDTDVFFASGLHDLLKHDCVFPFEELTASEYLRRQLHLNWEIGNFGFGASAGHPFLKAVIENCVRAQRQPDWVKPMMRGIPPMFRSEFYILNTTGPGLVSRTLAETPEFAKSVTVLFPDDVCNTDTWHQFGNFGIHSMEGSWRSQGNHFLRRLANLWEAQGQRRSATEIRRENLRKAA